MSDFEQMGSSDAESSSARISVRIPRKQYDLMKRLGAVLGLETDGACVRHFVLLGLQSSANGISSIQTVDQHSKLVLVAERMNESVEQLDLVKEVEKRVS